MSFYVLLILLSLIVIVPIIFVLKEKSKHSQIDSIQRHQEYLTAASVIAAPSQTDSTAKNNKENNELSIINFSAHHPFIKLLYDAQVPKTFRAVMDDIGQSYESIHHEQITESQFFTLNKLIATRVPELINDYMSLEQHYAKTVIIDSDRNNTSYDMVLDQLTSILDFSQKLSIQSQSGVVDKLLASRRYLDDVYKESGMKADSLKIK